VVASLACCESAFVRLYALNQSQLIAPLALTPQPPSDVGMTTWAAVIDQAPTIVTKSVSNERVILHLLI